MKKLTFAALLYVASIAVAAAGSVSTASSGSSLDGAEAGGGGGYGVDIFVRGVNGDWGLTNPMSYDGGTNLYTATVNLSVMTHEFKVASEDWSTVDFGNITGEPTFSPPYTLEIGPTSFGNISMDISSAGDYLFTLDPDTNLLTIEAVVIPIPAAALLLGPALIALGLFRRR